VRDRGLLSFNIKHLMKWTLIVGGAIVIINMLGLAAYLSVNQELNWITFKYLLLSYLMIEGLVITLMGCATLFGFKKYAEWPTKDARRRSEQNKNTSSDKEIGSRMNFGTFFVVLGMSLFLLSFIVFSFLF